MTDHLDFARHLHALDVPIWTAPPGALKEFDRPPGWSHLQPSGNPARVKAHLPGHALAGNMGGRVVVVDVDVRNGGDPVKVRELLDALHVTIYADVQTPGGGRHFYIAGQPSAPTVHASEGRDGLEGFPGVEVISYGANVFLPGTQRPKYDGGGYVVLVDNLEALADGGDPLAGETFAGWVAEHRAHNAEPFTPSRPWDGASPDKRQAGYLAAVLTRQCAELAAMGPDSGRNGQLYTAGLKCGNLVAGAGMDEAQVIAQLTAAADACGLTRDDGPLSVKASILSGLRNGRARPRAVPPPKDHGSPSVTGGPIHELEQIPDGVDPVTGEVLDTPAVGFWDERECLAHLRDFARARMTSPWAVLGVTLARALCTVPPYVVLPPTIGTEASLNLFVALVGPSGMGKGAAEGAARDALDMGEVFTATVGSGEGVAHLYSHWTAKTGIVRDRSAVLFSIPEVDTLTALGSRLGSTILSVLRGAFSGERLGFSNASKERTLPLDRHTYRLCVVLGVQPERAGALLGDADGGTPQRFLWMPVADPGVPDETPEAPDPVKLVDQQWRRGNFPNQRVVVPRVAVETIRDAHRARHRGEGDALDGHALLCRLKAAVALTFLDGRRVVTDDDWRLAGTVMAVSDATRAGVAARLAEQANSRTEAQGRADGIRADAAAQSADERAARRISARLLGKVVAVGELSRGDLRKTLPGRDRKHFNPALDRLVAAGQVEVLDVEYQGQTGQRIKATGATP